MPLSGQACIHTWSPVDNSGQETPLDALWMAIEGREEGRAGSGLDSGRAAIATAKRYVRWQFGTMMSRHRGAGRGMYVCMYVHTIVDGMACMCSICLYHPASLTLSLAVMSAPCCRRSEQIAVWPLQAA